MATGFTNFIPFQWEQVKGEILGWLDQHLGSVTVSAGGTGGNSPGPGGDQSMPAQRHLVEEARAALQRHSGLMAGLGRGK